MQFDTKEKYDDAYEIVRKYYVAYFKNYLQTLIFIINDKTIDEMDNCDKEKVNTNLLINSLLRCAHNNDYSLKTFTPTIKGDYVLTFKRDK